MEKINEKDLKFLDFILQIICNDFNANHAIEFIAKDYEKSSGVKYSINDLRYFISLYKNKYFITRGTDFHIKAIPKIKEIIDAYGSLSEYLHKIQRQNKKAKIKRTLIKISASLAALLLLIFNIISWSYSNKLMNENDNLDKEIIKKDSVILELKKQIIKNDTTIIKTQ
ncbi:MAG: hypothetical protein PF484_08915 [Bacteroidales bacterium]|jgi:hypothetical protein|nr:hypothetical protein [Bacteroidales bacterium]